MLIVIGISGKKRAGKDTVGNFIKEMSLQLGFDVTRRAMADKLKEECAALVHDHTNKPYFGILDEMNTDGEKEQYRLLLQWWGTELRRRMCRDDYWLVAMRQWIANLSIQDLSPNAKQMVLIPDIRFPNEVEMVKKMGGIVIRVNRPGLDADTHASECALDEYTEWDGIIDNDADLDELRLQTQRMLAKFKKQWKL